MPTDAAAKAPVTYPRCTQTQAHRLAPVDRPAHRARSADPPDGAADAADAAAARRPSAADAAPVGRRAGRLPAGRPRAGAAAAVRALAGDRPGAAAAAAGPAHERVPAAAPVAGLVRAGRLPQRLGLRAASRIRWRGGPRPTLRRRSTRRAAAGAAATDVRAGAEGRGAARRRGPAAPKFSNDGSLTTRR